MGLGLQLSAAAGFSFTQNPVARARAAAGIGNVSNNIFLLHIRWLETDHLMWGHADLMWGGTFSLLSKFDIINFQLGQTFCLSSPLRRVVGP